MTTKRVIAVVAASLIAAAGLGAVTSGPARAGIGPSVAIFTTPGPDSWLVPDDVCIVAATIAGAPGGMGGGSAGGAPGTGGIATVELEVTPGETLSMIVGGAGQPGGATAGAGGTNGGGAGGGTNSTPGGGGGGRSEVLRGSTPLVIAGGGGGGGGGSTSGPGGGGGSGGNASGTGVGTAGTDGGGLAGGDGGAPGGGNPQGGTGTGADGAGGGGGGGAVAGNGGAGSVSASVNGGGGGGGGGTSTGPAGTVHTGGATAAAVVFQWQVDPACAGGPGEFPEPGEHEFVVPEGVCVVTATAYGAPGGGSQTSFGGTGAIAVATLEVTAGETLGVVVGGAGGEAVNPLGGPAGANGGGTGGDGAFTGTGDGIGGGGGGGASEVLRGESPLLVAGGGGGAGGMFDNPNTSGVDYFGGDGGAAGASGTPGGGPSPGSGGAAGGGSPTGESVTTGLDGGGGGGGGGGAVAGNGGGFGSSSAGGGGGGGTSLGPPGATFTTGSTNSAVEFSWEAGAGCVGDGRPDAAVQVHGTTPIFGENVYGDATNQTVTASARRGQTAVFDVKVQNDGSSPDSFRLLGSGGIAAMKVVYVKGLSGSTQITNPVLAGTYATAELGPGAAVTVRLKVKVQASAVVGSVRPFTVTATSVDDGTTTDTVRARVKVI